MDVYYLSLKFSKRNHLLLREISNWILSSEKNTFTKRCNHNRKIILINLNDSGGLLTGTHSSQHGNWERSLEDVVIKKENIILACLEYADLL